MTITLLLIASACFISMLIILRIAIDQAAQIKRDDVGAGAHKAPALVM